ncbi:MAG: NAD(P)H-binding protein [Pseudomonadota bacterium]
MTQTIVLFGATGTIGRATARALRNAGYRVVAPVRGDASVPGCETVPFDDMAQAMVGAMGVMTCIASRSGTPKDSWAVDYQCNAAVLAAAVSAGVSNFVMLSAICVQKPTLAFQKAKLRFETELQAAPLTWSIVRPTAFFKSLSGQLDRVQQGKPFLVFGDGTLTACKPISDNDLAAFLVSCLTDAKRQDRILPIGGTGPALTPMDQVAILADILGDRPKVKHVPIWFLKTISAVLGVVPGLKDKAALARIGQYYATESMLVWDGYRYDPDATPEHGSDTLADHYRALIQGQVTNERGSHAVF